MKTRTLGGLKGGMQRLRAKGGASQDYLYDLVNAYVDATGSPRSRPGTTKAYTLPAGTTGLTVFAGKLQVFSARDVTGMPDGVELNILRHPDPAFTGDIKEIHFAKPFVGKLYIVVEFDDGHVYHYWLRTPDPWQASHVYGPDSIVSPTAAHGKTGFLYVPSPVNSPPEWKANQQHAAGDQVVPTTPNGFLYTVKSVSGDSPASGNVEPDWTASDGAQVYETVGDAGRSSAAGTIPTWDSAHTYVPGTIVKPKTRPAPPSYTLVNGGFEDGADHWEFGAGLTIATRDTYAGTHRIESARQTTGTERLLALNTTQIQTAAGASIHAQAMINQGASSDGVAGGRVVIHWFKTDDSFITESFDGDVASSPVSGQWLPSTVTATAPRDAAYARIGVSLYTKDRVVAADAVTVLSSSYTGPPADTVYQATQTAPGKSAYSEPAWPTQLGDTVVDNGVIWKAIIATQIVWEASPLMQSGATEPDWPVVAEATVNDNTINWTAVPTQVTDKNCPQSKIVAIAAAKIYAADNHVIRFSATSNPLDWTSKDDAGYLPFGLQTFGANPVAAMGLYRSNLAAFNSEGFQLWQVDPNPANMSLLDALPLGSTQNKALAPVANDLLCLTPEGVRSIGIAGASVNLQAGGVGKPIDPLVTRVADWDGQPPRATYYPGAGQYWLAYNQTDGTAQAFIYTTGKPRGWSRYTLPYPVDEFCHFGDAFYLRSGDKLLTLDEAVQTDDGTAFDVTIQWPWLGGPVTRQLLGFDIVGDGVPTIEIGYDETDKTAHTAAFDVPVADTVPGQMIPLPVMAPSLSVKVTYQGANQMGPTRLQAVTLYYNEMRATA